MNSMLGHQNVVRDQRLSEPVFVFLAYLLVQFSILAISDHFPGDHPVLIATIFSTFSATFAAVLAGMWINRTNGDLYIGRMRLSAIHLVICVAGGILTSLAVYPLLMAIPSSGPADPLLAKAFLDKGPAMLLAWMASVLVVGPIGEEMVFRGALLGYLSARIGTAAAIVVAALLFLLLHLPQLDGYWPAMLAILGLGLVAGIARVKTGSLLGAIAVHIAYNSVVMAFVLGGRS